MGFYFSLVLMLVILAAVPWLVFKRKSHQLHEFIPTLSWQILMVSSFVYQYQSFDSEVVRLQSFAIAVFSMAIFFSDFIRVPSLSVNLQKFRLRIAPERIALIIVLVAAGVHTYHLYAMPEIPLVTRVKDKFDALVYWLQTGDVLEWDPSRRYLELREKASKLLDLPVLFIYLCNGMLLAFAPLSIFILFYRKKWIFASTALCFFLFYSRASLAKGPLYLFLAVLILQCWLFIHKKWRDRIFKSGVIAASLFGVYSLWVLSTNPSSLFVYKAPTEVVNEYFQKIEDVDPPVPKILTNADHHRLYDKDDVPNEIKGVDRYINFLAYRAWFVPVEVSHFWYIYFKKVEMEPLGFYGLTPGTRSRSDFVHPANRVGVWAYVSRFPDHYYKSIRAYCSIDADAYARFGVLGIVVIALALILMRILWKALLFDGPIGNAINIGFLFVLGTALPTSSIFAIVVANGIFFYFVLLLTVRLLGISDQKRVG